MKKVLGVIGGFFAKIGRWIANTAWIQPLLIVGGIFAIIFSIPYIKQGIENAQNSNQVDEDIEYYKARAISLDGAENHESKMDTLLTYLEEDNFEKVKEEFGTRFFLTLATEDCAYCKECVAGYTYLNDHFSEFELEGEFKLYSFMIDTTNDDGKNLAQMVFEQHEDFFDDIIFR